MSNVDCAGIILSAGWICLWQVWGGDNGVADSEESAVQGHHRPELENVFWQMWVGTLRLSELIMVDLCDNAAVRTE